MPKRPLPSLPAARTSATGIVWIEGVFASSASSFSLNAIASAATTSETGSSQLAMAHPTALVGELGLDDDLRVTAEQQAAVDELRIADRDRQCLRERVDRPHRDPIAHLGRQIVEVCFVVLRNHEVRDARSYSAEDLLFQPADRQHTTRERD